MDGKLFASRAEMNRYCELRMLERAGHIRDLVLQPAFILQPAYIRDGKKVQALTYRADFGYLDVRTNRNIIEDCKGHITDVYAIKKKILLYVYPDLNFVEVKV